MKTRAFLFLTSIAFLLACESGEQSQNGEEQLSTDLINNPETAAEGEVGETKLPEFEFSEEVVDFGDISQGERVKKRFEFKNVGNADLIISNASGSCGCTVPSWPRQPIRPGQKGVIDVEFNSEGKSCRQHKTVTLIANTVPNKKTLALKGNVITPNTENNN